MTDTGDVTGPDARADDLERRTQALERQVFRAKVYAGAGAVALAIIFGIGWLDVPRRVRDAMGDAGVIQAAAEAKAQLASARTSSAESKATADEAAKLLKSIQAYEVAASHSGWSLACSVPSCVAVTRDGTIYHYNAHEYRVFDRRKVIDLSPPFSVACNHEARCVIVDGTGRANVGNANNPAVWSKVNGMQ